MGVPRRTPGPHGSVENDLYARTLVTLLTERTDELRTKYGKAGSEHWWTPPPEETPRDILTVFLFDPNRRLERIWAGMIGELQTVRVMYVSDYASHEKNQDTSRVIVVAMERCMPGHRVLVSKAEGPFSDEDEFGTLSWFPAVDLHQKAEKVVLDLRRDFFTSVVKLLREIALKAPDFLIGIGQGVL